MRGALSHFNPRSPHGERPAAAACLSWTLYFNPRSPHGERRTPRSRWPPPCNFNPRSPHGERLLRAGRAGCDREISIHAPRTGSDFRKEKNNEHDFDFNPRSPHGERLRHAKRHNQHGHISIHAPRTGSDTKGGEGRGKACKFQSTLPARGATKRRTAHRGVSVHFNPRSPHGERRFPCGCFCRHRLISIHAPRTGSDLHRPS